MPSASTRAELCSKEIRSGTRIGKLRFSKILAARPLQWKPRGLLMPTACCRATALKSLMRTLLILRVTSKALFRPGCLFPVNNGPRAGSTPATRTRFVLWCSHCMGILTRGAIGSAIATARCRPKDGSPSLAGVHATGTRSARPFS